MKKVLVIVAIVLVVFAGWWLLRTGLGPKGNATFQSYAPGGAEVAYVVLDTDSSIKYARTSAVELVNGDRVRVRVNNDGSYEITGGPYR